MVRAAPHDVVAPRLGAVKLEHWPRRADVDALRVLAVVLVLVVHAAMVYSPWQTWHVQNDVRSKWLAELTLLPGPWLMGLFMLLAGRSAFYSLEHRSDLVYLRERTARLFVPLLAGTLLLVPPMLYVRRTLEGRFDGSFIAFYPHFFEGLYPEGNLSWGHLWFLAYLLVYGTILLPLLRAIAQRYRGGRPLRSGRIGLLVFVAACASAQVALRAPFPQTNALVNDWANHAQLLPAFLFGFVLAADPALEALLRRTRYVTLALALAASTIVAVYAWPGNFGEALPASDSWRYASFWTAESVATWAWLFSISAFAQRGVTRERPWLVRSREIVYPFYVLHQPVLVLIAWKLVPLHVPLFAEFLLLTATAFIATVGACELARRWQPARLLLGIRAATPSPATR